MFNRIFALMMKEFQLLWRDKRSRFFLLVSPVMQLFIFAFAATLDVQNVPIGFFDRDKGQLGYELFERFEGAKVFSKVLTINSEKEAERFINMMEGMMVVSVDERFSEDIMNGKDAKVSLLLDGRKSNSSQIVAGYADTIVHQFAADYSTSVQYLLDKTKIVATNWFNPNLLYTWYTVPCLTGLLVMLVCLVITSLTIARERELGTFDQLLVSPISPLEILIGKTLPAVTIAMFEGTLIIAGGLLFFGVPFTGSIFLLWFCMLVFIISIAGIGLFVSSLCSTQQQAVLGAFSLMPPMVVLSGFATPIENMPSWLQPLTVGVPLRHYLYIAKGIFLKALPFADVIHAIIPLIIIGAITLSLATYLFHSRLE